VIKNKNIFSILNEIKKNKFLVIRLSSLGDVILATAFLRCLKKTYPYLLVDFLVKEQYADVLKINPYINCIFIYPADNKTENLIKNLKNEKYDEVIDLQNNFRSQSITSKLNAQIYRYKKPSLKKFILVNFKINLYNEIKTIPQMYCEARPGVKYDGAPPEIYCAETNIAKPENKLVVLCPGSKHFSKMWPEEYYLELSKMLTSNGFSVFVTGGSSDKQICNYISENNPEVKDYSNNNVLSETAGVINIADAVVCNDSGLMHIASALGRKGFAVFGSSVREFGFAPAGNLEIVENVNLKCRPCSHTGKSACPKKHFKCMKEILPEIIFKKLNNLLNGKN